MTKYSGPVGRMVQGDAWTPNDEDYDGNPLTVKTGANAGQPRVEYFIGVAYAKTDPAALAYLLQLKAEMVAAWPALFPGGGNNTPPSFGCTDPTFSSKIIDGDGLDRKGKPHNAKEGFAGHWVVRYSSGYAPEVTKMDEHGKRLLVTDKGELRRGYYVRPYGLYATNGNTANAGMYSNLDKISVERIGEVIISGPTAEQAFDGAPGGPAAAAPPPPPAAGVAAAPPPPPPAAAAPPPPPAAPARVMLPAAGGQTYEAFTAAGWTDVQLIAAGMMAEPPSSTAAFTPPPPPPPAAAAPPPPPPAAPARVMLPAAAGQTYEALIAAGWTDALLVQNSMMSPPA